MRYLNKSKPIAFLLWLLLIGPFTGFGQQTKSVKGVVVDEVTKEPLAGVTVQNLTKKSTATTNVIGSYTIVAVAGDVLAFSYLGYENKQVKVDKVATINIGLATNNQKLNEVVVIGYGSVSQKDITGSVGQLDMNAVSKAPVMSVSQALAGRIAGVSVTSPDGQPGTSDNIVIRGLGSLTQDTSPLYVVDGFPIEGFNLSALNAEDIEAINILKDASATAIYGSRGANGVIIIETKKGKVGKPQVAFNTSLGYQQPHKFMELMDPYEFVLYQYQRNKQATIDRFLTVSDENGNPRTLDYYKNVEGIDWQRLILKSDNLTQRYDLSVRGGNNDTKYSLSGSYYDFGGIVINSGSHRLQGRFALDQNLSKKIKVGVNYNYSERKNSGMMVNQSTGGNLTGNIFFNMWGYKPVSGTGDPNDLLIEDYDPLNMNVNDTRFNPVVLATSTIRNENIRSSIFNGYATWDIVKGLQLKISGGNSHLYTKRDIFYNSESPNGSPKSPFNNRGINGSITYEESNIWSNENYLTYKKTFKKGHDINAVLGMSMQERTSYSQGVGVSFLPNEDLGFADFGSGVPYNTPSSAGNYTLLSTFLRLNYNYKWKYFLTGTFRMDGSSKFAKENRYGYFPSAAFSWNMMRENFMKKLKYLSTSKFRISYGVTGNNRVGDFDTYSKLNLPLAAGYPFNNSTPVKGAVVTSLGNPDLKWESSYQFNVGYDLGFLKDRYKLTIDYYNKTTKDLLLLANIPFTSGFQYAYQNVGSLQNRGLELTLNTVNIRTKKFFWETNFNISFNRNKVLGLADGEKKRFTSVTFDNLFADPLYLAEVGKPLAMFYGYIWDGVYQYSDFDSPSPGTYVLKKGVPTNGNDPDKIQPGHIKYRDLNGDGTVNDNDLAVLGNALPIHTGGFTSNFNYKGFDLSIFFQWSYGNKIYNANRLMLEGNAFSRTDLNQFKSYVDRWSPDNQNSKNYIAGGQGPTGRYSDRVLEDGSFLRLKTVSLGYSLPVSWIKKTQLTSLKLNVATQNLWTWTKYSGLDPEVSTRNSILTPGFDYSAYPQARTVVFGLSANF